MKMESKPRSAEITVSGVRDEGGGGGGEGGGERERCGRQLAEAHQIY